MAQRIQIEFLSQGFHELLMSDEIAEQVDAAAKKIADRATTEAASVSKARKKPEYVVKGPKAGGFGGGRIIAYVAADNAAAYTDQVRNARLESVIWEVAE